MLSKDKQMMVLVMVVIAMIQVFAFIGVVSIFGAMGAVIYTSALVMACVGAIAEIAVWC